MTTNQEKIYNKCIKDLPLATAMLSDEYYYDSIVFCLIDSIYSIGVKYPSVRNTVINYCSKFSLTRIQTPKGAASDIYTIQSFLNDMSAYITSDFGATSIYKNAQRTSSKSGILKAEAVYKAAEILKKNRIFTLNDIRTASISSINSLRSDFTSIKGQKSGISFEYFLMLSGDDDTMKIDRWLIRFCEEATGASYTTVDAYRDLMDVEREIKKVFPSMSARLLDHTIWNYARNNL